MTIFRQVWRNALALARAFGDSTGGGWLRYGWALGAAVALVTVSLAANMLASRALGLAGFGQFAVGVATLTLLGTAMGLGMPVTMVRFWGRLSEATVEARERSRLQAWGLVLIAGALVGGAFLVFQAVAPCALAKWVPPKTALILVLGGLGAALTQMAAAEAQMRLNFRGYFFTVATASGLRLAGLGIVVLAVGGRVWGALLGFGLGSFVAGGAMTWEALHGARRWLSSQFGVLRSSASALVVFGLPILGSTLVVAAIEYIDILILATSLPSERVGVYSAGARLLIVQATVLAALTTVALPLASRAAADGRQGEFARSVLSFGIPLGLLVTSALVASSPILVAVIYGPAYVESAPVFAILSVGLLPNFIGNPASQMLYAAGAPGLLLYVHVGQLVALVLGLPFVAARWDLVGVAIFRSVVNAGAVAVILMHVVRVSRRGRQLAVVSG